MLGRIKEAIRSFRFKGAVRAGLLKIRGGVTPNGSPEVEAELAQTYGMLESATRLLTHGLFLDDELTIRFKNLFSVSREQFDEVAKEEFLMVAAGLDEIHQSILNNPSNPDTEGIRLALWFWSTLFAAATFPDLRVTAEEICHIIRQYAPKAREDFLHVIGFPTYDEDEPTRSLADFLPKVLG